jgi:hypothetical protein
MKKDYPLFDRSQLVLEPLKRREHLIDQSQILPLMPVGSVHPSFQAVASQIRDARKNHSSIVFMMGAHVIRSGVQRYIIDLMEQGFISCISMNGAGVIHDFEFALIGATTESVSHYISNGQFGLWQETARINDIVKKASQDELGLGEAVGRFIAYEKFPHQDISLLAAAYRLGCPVTVHVGIGYDIIYEHPNCDGAAWGKTSYMDFLRFVHILESIDGGVVMNFGSAVMAPEVFLKALAMVRNAAHQKGRVITNITTLVCDLLQLPSNYHQEASHETADYFYRPWKTMLVRTVSNGGRSFYVQGKHAETIPQLWTAITCEK